MTKSKEKAQLTPISVEAVPIEEDVICECECIDADVVSEPAPRKVSAGSGKARPVAVDREDDAQDVIDADIADVESDVVLTGEVIGPEEDGELVPLPDEEESEDDGEVIDADGEETALVPATRNLPQVRDSLHAYVREVSRFPLLDPAEERKLTSEFRDTHDPKAGMRIVTAHLRLVVKIALDFQRRWMQNVLDLVQEGNTGLMHALYKFDPDKGIKFSYYASFWIKAYIIKFIMDNYRLVKIGTTQVQRKLFFNLNKERQKLIASGFVPDKETLARNLGVTPEDIEDMDQRMSAVDVSLNAPIGEESDSATRMDFLPALGPAIEDSIANVEISDILRSKLEALRGTLSDKELFILENRLLSDSPMTLRNIGQHFDISRERVRQVESRVIGKIKALLTSDLKDFSDEWIRQ